MALNEVPFAISHLLKRLPPPPEVLEHKMQQVGIETETFDLLELPPRARRTFVHVLTLLIGAGNIEDAATRCTAAYLTALALAQEYDDPDWKTKL